MAMGIRKHDEQAREIIEEFYNGPVSQIAVFYGLRGNLRQVFADYRMYQRKAVHVDLGYWNRTEGGKLYGYHKVTVNNRHPTAYFQNKRHPHDRFSKLGLQIKPWRTNGEHILVAGMGPKAADVEGFAPNQWEKDAVAKLRMHTDRPIIYRPKPSWHHPEPIDGTMLSPNNQPLEEVLRKCHAVVSHHSNVCVDALIEGVPVFCVKGVAVTMGLNDISKIEEPLIPDGREQWAADIAYCQWRPDEMKEGLVWRHLKNEGLI